MTQLENKIRQWNRKLYYGLLQSRNFKSTVIGPTAQKVFYMPVLQYRNPIRTRILVALGMKLGFTGWVNHSTPASLTVM
jgi:hypothetical protein